MTTSATKVGDGIKKGFTIAMGAVTALVGVVTGAVMVTDDFTKAQNHLQAETGATADEMKELADNMKAVYANNFGESIEDVANVMAEVKNVTGLVGEELEKATERAFLMRDVFKYDTAESIRTVDQLMKQFEITADEAFNLIAQGAQAGLDKDGSLLGSINEYAVHFENLGFTADDMFNVIKNGAEVGVYDVDKLGDAMKEFGILSKDGSDTSAEAFETLGFNADEMFQIFANGGDQARDSFIQVIEKLGEIDDAVLQEQLGTALFATMWEDAGKDAILALGEVEGAIDSTKTALDDMNAIKYDDLGSAIEGIKRMIEVNFLVPLGEKAIPKLEEFGEYLQDNLPTMLESATNFMEGFVEVLGFLGRNFDIILPVATAFVTTMTLMKASFAITKLINAATVAFTAYKLANEGATVATWLLSAAQKALPILTIISLVAGLVAGIIALWNTNEDFRNAVIAIWGHIQSFIGAVVEAIVSFFTTTIPNALSGLSDFWATTWQGMTDFFGNIWDTISGMAESAIDFIGGLLSGLWDSIQNVIGALFGMDDTAQKTTSSANASVNSVHSSGTTPKPRTLTGYATGTKNSVDNFIVGENGAELMLNAGGSRIFPADDTAQILNMMREPLPVPIGTGEETINHTGTIRVEGYSSTGEYDKVVEVVIDELKRELRIV